jgi:hypothetical protein
MSLLSDKIEVVIECQVKDKWILRTRTTEGNGRGSRSSIHAHCHHACSRQGISLPSIQQSPSHLHTRNQIQIMSRQINKWMDGARTAHSRSGPAMVRGQAGEAWVAALVETEEEESHIFPPVAIQKPLARNTESRRLVLTGGKGMDVGCPCITPPRRERGRERGERKGRCHG